MKRVAEYKQIGINEDNVPVMGTVYRDATPEEIAETERQQAELPPRRPTPEERIADLTAKLDAIIRYQGLAVRQIESGVYEVVKNIPQVGDFIDPIPWQIGDSVKDGLWYYADNKELPHEAIASGVPESFYDTTYFDFV